MDNATSGHSILDTLRTVEFRLGLKGYNVDEVDEYLEKAAVEAEQVQERLRSANERLRTATERVAQLEGELEHRQAERAVDPGAPGEAPPMSGAGPQEAAVSNDTLQRTLLLAQKFVDQTKRESEAEAARLVGQAEERARQLLAQTEERARQLTSEAEERLRDEVGRLEVARERLAGDLEAMTRHLEDQRTKIRTSLTEMLRWVDERLTAPARTAEPPADRSLGQLTADRKPAESIEKAGSATSGEPGGSGAVGSGSTGGAGPGSPVAGRAGETRPQPPPQSGAPDRHPSAPSRSHAAAAPDRSQTPVGARPGALHRDLFEAGRDETVELERSRIGE
jgi:DivIVA domain-containing protein